MASSIHGKRIEMWRRWQQRLGKLAMLFTIAAIIALAWSLFIGPGHPGDGGSWTLTADRSGNAAIWGTVAGSQKPRPDAGNPDGGKATGSTKPSAQANGSSPSGNGQLSGHAGSAARDESGPASDALPRVSSADDIPVYIVGAVARPGVYIVRRNSYLYELVDKAGGLTADAAATVINLALKLSENQMVRIPTEAEADDPLNPNPYPSAPSTAKPKTVNINTATPAELETLPGIGPATAAAIVADRTKNGPFKQPEDIMRVAGVKESRYEQLEPLISVR